MLFQLTLEFNHRAAMNILILGSGGREHSLAWAVMQNPKCHTLIAAPGNAGISQIATCVDIDIEDGNAVADLANEKSIDFVIIGPEAPLAGGVADTLRARGIPVFGPSKQAAQLETSKSFTKEICMAAGVPTAPAKHFLDPSHAKAFLAEGTYPIVIKADGLAAGKGVVVASDTATALTAIDKIFDDPSNRHTGVLIEDYIEGQEVSYFILCDGETILPIGAAQDHKRIGDGDTGPNTGGMGAYSPAPVLTPNLEKEVLNRIISPTIAEMYRRGTPYQGVLYAGLMIRNAKPFLIEYNARFGDPEAQVLMMRLGAQAFDLFHAVVEKRLCETRVNWADDHALTVVLATKGYPGEFQRGSEIKGLETLKDSSLRMCFHAGTKKQNGRYLANGGRVLNATARGSSLQEARDFAYKMIESIDWPDGIYRQDIGWRALK